MKKLSDGQPPAVTFLFGEETFLIEKAVHAFIDQTTDPETRDFNCDILHGESCEGDTIIQIASSFPMISERRIVVVRALQKCTSSDRKKIMEYIESPLESTILVLTAGKIDRRQRFYSSLIGQSCSVECKPLYEKQAISWVVRTLQDKGVALTQEGAMILVQQTGTGLWALSNEIEKLRTFAWGKQSLDLEDVVQVVGFSRKFNNWEFTDAVCRREFRSAMIILHHLLDEGQSPVGLIMDLARRFFILMRIHALMRLNRKETDVCKALGLRTFLARIYIEQARRFSIDEVNHALISLTTADRSIKTGRMETPLVMTLLVRSIIHGSDGG